MAKQKSTSQSKAVSKAPTLQKRTEERLEAVIGQIENSDTLLSDKHIDKYFDLRSKTIKAIREDHKDIVDLTKHGRKYALFYAIAGIISIAVIVILIGIFAKDYLGRFFELLFAFLGGTGVGAVINNRVSSKSE